MACDTSGIIRRQSASGEKRRIAYNHVKKSGFASYGKVCKVTTFNSQPVAPTGTAEISYSFIICVLINVDAGNFRRIKALSHHKRQQPGATANIKDIDILATLLPR